MSSRLRFAILFFVLAGPATWAQLPDLRFGDERPLAEPGLSTFGWTSAMVGIAVQGQNYVAFWREPGLVLASVINADGERLGPPREIFNSSQGHVGDVAVSETSSGAFVLLWIHDRDVMVTTLSATLTAARDPVRIGENANSDTQVELACNASRCIATWQSDRTVSAATLATGGQLIDMPRVVTDSYGPHSVAATDSTFLLSTRTPEWTTRLTSLSESLQTLETHELAAPHCSVAEGAQGFVVACHDFRKVTAANVDHFGALEGEPILLGEAAPHFHASSIEVTSSGKGYLVAYGYDMDCEQIVPLTPCGSAQTVFATRLTPELGVLDEQPLDVATFDFANVVAGLRSNGSNYMLGWSVIHPAASFVRAIPRMGDPGEAKPMRVGPAHQFDWDIAASQLGALATYREPGPDWNAELRAQRVDWTGQQVGTPITITSGKPFGVNVASDGQDYVVQWQLSRPDLIRTAFVDGLTGEVTPGSETWGYGGLDGSLDWIGTGYLTVVARDKVLTAVRYSPRGEYAGEFTIGADEFLSSATIAATSDRILIAWNNIASGTRFAVFDRDGKLLSPIASVPGRARPRVIVDGDEFIVVSPADSIILATRVDRDGVAAPFQTIVRAWLLYDVLPTSGLPIVVWGAMDHWSLPWETRAAFLMPSGQLGPSVVVSQLSKRSPTQPLHIAWQGDRSLAMYRNSEVETNYVNDEQPQLFVRPFEVLEMLQRRRRSTR